MKHFLILFFLLVGVVTYAQPGPPNLTANYSAGAGSFCPGVFVWLEATGCSGTVDWQGIIGPSQGNSTFTITSSADNFPNSTYESAFATCTDGSGTSGQASVTWEVKPQPRIMSVELVGGGNSACPGQPVQVHGFNCVTGSGVTNIIWADGQSCPGVSECYISLTLFNTFDVGPSCSDGAWGCASNPAPFVINVGNSSPNWQFTNNYQCNGNAVDRQQIDANPCTGNAPQWVTVDATGCTPPVVSASPSPICIGQSVNVSVANCSGGTVNWSPTGSGQSFTDSPSGDITYTASCINSYGLNTGSSSASVQVINLSAPSISASAASIVIGGSVNISASGCPGTLNWSPTGSGSSFTDSPGADITYTATCSFNGCTSPAGSVFVQVINVPDPTVSASPAAICAGGSSVLTASGCPGTYVWSTGETGPSITVSPASTTTYDVECVLGGGNSNAITVQVTVYPIPSSPALASSLGFAICAGQSTVLTASGCNGTYTWSTGEQGASITVSPVTSTLYSVNCTENGCTGANGQAGITVNPLPTAPTITADVAGICAGGTINLSAAGCAGTVTWSDGGTGATRAFSPASSIALTATCSDACGTSGPSNMLGFTVNPLPSAPSIGADQTVVCIGTTVNLTAGGCAGTVTWSDGITGATRTYVVNASGQFTATCSDACGTSAPASPLGFTANPLPTAPTVSADQTNVCAGSTVNLTAAGCAGTISWSDGGAGATRTYIVNAAGTLTATCSDACGTSGPSNGLTFTTLPAPVAPVISADKLNICVGGGTNLTASGCAGTITWSDGGSGATRFYSPASSVVLTATCADACGTSAPSNSLAITVDPIPSAPTLSASPASICAGGSTVLTASNCAGSVSWSTGEVAASITVSPVSTQNYTAFCTVGTCVSPDGTVTVTVNPIPATPVLFL